MQELFEMNGIDVARALKDEDYRTGLSPEIQLALQSMVGASELSEQDLEDVSGGFIMRDTVIVRPHFNTSSAPLNTDSGLR